MRSGIRLGRLAGIDVIMDWSLLIIFFLITLSLGAGLFPTWHPDWSPALIWITSLAAAALFLLSVFLHELSHALVGRAKGIDIKRITLFVFGGMAHLEREPQQWRAELWMALVGPVTSLALGVFFITLGNLLVGPMEVDPENPQEALSKLGPIPSLLFWLGPVNIILGLFNLVPGFPLDGGRVLRAVLWGITNDVRKATRWASQMGQAFAWFLIISGVAMMFGLRVPIFGTGVVSGLWLAFIGWFLHNAALMSYRQLLVRESLEGVPVSRLMQADVMTVRPDITVDQLVNEHLMRTDQRAFPVLENDRLAGMICFHDIRKISRNDWPRAKIRDVMTPADKLIRITSQEDVAEALQILSRQSINQLPVVDNERLRGLIRREDILKWLSLYGDESPERLGGGGDLSLKR